MIAGDPGSMSALMIAAAAVLTWIAGTLGPAEPDAAIADDVLLLAMLSGVQI